MVSHVLQTPCNEDVDGEMFVDMAAAIGPYLVQPRFQEAVLATHNMLSAFKLIERTSFLLANSPKADEGQAPASQSRFVH